MVEKPQFDVETADCADFVKTNQRIIIKFIDICKRYRHRGIGRKMVELLGSKTPITETTRRGCATNPLCHRPDFDIQEIEASARTSESARISAPKRISKESCQQSVNETKE